MLGVYGLHPYFAIPRQIKPTYPIVECERTLQTIKVVDIHQNCVENLQFRLHFLRNNSFILDKM